MFSVTLKRSAATLGVVAGLFTAAAPASAQILDGPILWDTPRAGNLWGPIVYVGTDGGALALVRSFNDVEANESISFDHLRAAGTETGNPER